MRRRHVLAALAALVAAAALPMAHAGAYEDFFRAIRRDDVPAIQRLLQRGFDPNSVDPEGRSGATLAMMNESWGVAAALIAHPQFKLDQANPAGETPLMLAALKGQVALCRQLIERGARLNHPGWAPLHYAASGGGVEVIRLLLEHHAYIDAESPNRSTPLMMAARYDSEEAVVLLLDEGADPLLRNDQQMTAADFARGVDRESVARLIEQRAGVKSPRQRAPIFQDMP